MSSWQSPRWGLWMCCLWALLSVHCLGSSAAQAAPESPESMTIDARVDPGAQTIAGRFTLRLQSRSDQDLAEVLLFAYPEVYGVEPELPDILAERVHPSAPEKASQRIHSVEVLVDGEAQNFGAPEFVWINAVPVVRIPGIGPLAAGTQVVISAAFETHIPRRYGSFGRVGSVVTVNGGLAPLPVQRGAQGVWQVEAPPAALAREVRLEIPPGWSGSIGSQLIEPEPEGEEPRQVHHRRSSSRWTSLSLRRQFQQQSLEGGTGAPVTFIGRPLRKLQRSWITQNVTASREALSELGVATDEPLLLVEAPLRRRLVERGEGVLFVSDRYLEASPLLWRYFDVHLAQAILAASLEELCGKREDPRLLPLVVNGISWSLVPDYLKVRWRNHVNLRRLLQGFSFLPYVDSLLETPVFPFADQLYDNPYVADPLRADVRRFNRPLRSGRLLFLRLEDEVGAATLRAAVLDAIDGASPPLPESLEERTGLSLQPIFERWLRAPPRIDYSLDPVERSRDAEGNHHTRIQVRRTTATDKPVRPVEVRLSPTLRPRKRNVKLTWSGEGQEATWEVITPWRVARIEVDPRGRVLEVDEHGLSLKQDNARPRPSKLTGHAYILPLCQASSAALVVNDSVDLAASFPGVGVHLGQEDGDPGAARRALGSEPLIGRSTHSPAQAREASRLSVDYIGFGPIFSSDAKHLTTGDGRAPRSPVGLAALKQVVRDATVSVVAIGGISQHNLPLVLATGVPAVAAISAVVTADNMVEAACALHRSIEAAHDDVQSL